MRAFAKPFTRSIALSLLPCLGLLAGPSAAAFKLSREVGVGALAGVSTEAGSLGSLDGDYALVLDGHNHFKQRTTLWQIKQYGFSQARLELGRGVGIALDAVSGIALLGLQDGQKGITPFLGIEPFSGRIFTHTRETRRDHYAWLPAVTTGLQYGFASCRVLPLAKAGASAGTLTRPGIWPGFGSTLGVAAHLNCRGFDLAGQRTRVFEGPWATELSTIDFSWAMKKSPIHFGTRYETISTPGYGPDEKRVLFMLHGRS
jgi:hypothetical protein